MDIEYDEWEVFEKISENTLQKFNQIICEFHFFFINQENVNFENLTPYFKSFSKKIITKK